MKKNYKKNYRELVLRLHRDIKMEMRTPSEVIKLLAISYYKIANDTSRTEAEREAAAIMLQQCQEIKRNKEMYSHYISTVRKNTQNLTCIFFAEQCIFKSI